LGTAQLCGHLCWWCDLCLPGRGHHRHVSMTHAVHYVCMLCIMVVVGPRKVSPASRRYGGTHHAGLQLQCRWHNSIQCCLWWNARIPVHNPRLLIAAPWTAEQLRGADMFLFVDGGADMFLFVYDLHDLYCTAQL
jgi:hypothetical protein